MWTTSPEMRAVFWPDPVGSCEEEEPPNDVHDSFLAHFKEMTALYPIPKNLPGRSAAEAAEAAAAAVPWHVTSKAARRFDEELRNLAYQTHETEELRNLAYLRAETEGSRRTKSRSRRRRREKKSAAAAVLQAISSGTHSETSSLYSMSDFDYLPSSLAGIPTGISVRMTHLTLACKVQQHCIQVIDGIIFNGEPPLQTATTRREFKIGIACDPQHRWNEFPHGYKHKRWRSMVVLYECPTAEGAAQLEAHLIYVYKNHANNIGCRNEAGGGEGISYRRSEALKLKCFTYVVFQDVIIAPGMDAQGSRSDRATGLITLL